ncbi:MAG: site-specific DNA-methyltransferase [Gammaproteobacteria bacterium]|nr:site-specific DNA-methyltransferase [Gammaproteobacteria bacterium]
MQTEFNTVTDRTSQYSRRKAAFSGLEHVAALSYGARNIGNLVIQGENLSVLDTIASRYVGRVRCIYIDPPYNNQERYTHYDDDLDHETWLQNITLRLTRLVDFLRDDGSLWISLDDREIHYLKVAADRIFGRKNFISTIVWQQRTTRENRKVFSNNHEYVLVYAKNARVFRDRRNPLPITSVVADRYKNPDNDPRGPWQSVSANVQAGHATPSQFYEIIAPNGKRHSPPLGRCWAYNKVRMKEEMSKNNVWFGRDGNGVPRLKKFLKDSRPGITPHTLWAAAEVGTNDSAKKHQLELFPKKSVFETPKPEGLISRILQIATNPDDLVLDAYLGSGTTAAVSHKMSRRYIGIENGAQAVTHCARRLRQVVDGEQGGISKNLSWLGGGGFDFYRATPNLRITKR